MLHGAVENPVQAQGEEEQGHQRGTKVKFQDTDTVNQEEFHRNNPDEETHRVRGRGGLTLKHDPASVPVGSNPFEPVGADPAASDRAERPTEPDPFGFVPERDISCPACLGKHRAHSHDKGCRCGPPPDVHFVGDWEPFQLDPVASEGAGEPVEDPRTYSCPACRGRHRPHTYDHRCRLEGEHARRADDHQASGASLENHRRCRGSGRSPAGRPKASSFGEVVGMPQAWEALCRANPADDEIDPDDPTVLEFVEINKAHGIQLTTMKEVRASVAAQREQWRLAMQAEVDSLRDNNTFEVARSHELRNVRHAAILPMKFVTGIKRGAVAGTVVTGRPVGIPGAHSPMAPWPHIQAFSHRFHSRTAA